MSFEDEWRKGEEKRKQELQARELEQLRHKQRTIRLSILYSSAGLVLLCLLIGTGMWGCPQYKVWQQELAGKAQLKRAEQNRQIKVQEAKAHEEASNHRARADSIRAIGTANANRIINESLTPEYIRWYFVEGLNSSAESGKLQIIYVPTEANVPITEASRLSTSITGK